jgi:hypothetical protein
MRAVKCIAALATAAALTTAAPAAADILPVGDWTLNEGKGTVAYDYAGHRHDGTLRGGAKWTQGRFQGGLSFNGNEAAVTVPDSVALEPATVSVSAWVDASSSPGNYRYVAAKGGNGCFAASYGLYTGANGGLEFYVSANDGLTWTVSPDAGQNLWNGQWHNVVGTFDGSTVRLYVDGRQVGTGTPNTTPIAYGLPTSNELAIGNYPWCPSSGFSGGIDEVKLFNRALSAQEIGIGYQLSRLLPGVIPFDLIL